jgi:outer membrane protein assembly factor BamB
VGQGNTIYAGSGAGQAALYALDANTGTLRWATALLPEIWNSRVDQLRVDGDLVVATYTIFLSQIAGGVAAVDRNTGELRWTTPFPPFPNAIPDTAMGGVSIAVWENTIIASADDGQIRGFDRTTGQLIWSIRGVGESWRGWRVNLDQRALYVLGSTLYVGSVSEWMIAFDLNTRQEIWRTRSPRGALNRTQIDWDGRALYMIDFSGNVVAFAADRPHVEWYFRGTRGTNAAQWEVFSGFFAFGPEPLMFVPSTQGYYAVRR